MNLEKEAALINKRIDASFKRLINTRYQIDVVFNHTYTRFIV